MCLNISESELIERNGIWTAKEIAQQPDTWLKTFQLITPSHFQFITPLIERAKRGQLRIIFTGAGTSAFIGDAVAPVLSEQFGCVIEAIASTDLVANPYQFLFADKPTLLVSFARSGNSPESVGAVNLVNQIVQEAYHLIITNNVAGELFVKSQSYPTACAIALPPETHDQSFAMTSSASNMMLAALCLFAPQRFNVDWVTQIVAVTTQLFQQDLTTIAQLAQLAVKRVAYLASGHLFGIARESALKLLELTAGEQAAFYETPLGFRHGPKSLVQNDTLIVLMGTANAYTARYEQDLYQELVRDNKAKKVLWLGATSGQISANFCQLDDVARIFPYLVFAQCYAFYSSLHLGYTPDNPCPTGEVNRVVQGVVLYDYSS